VAELALVERRPLRRMNEFDRIFQGNDMHGLVLIDLVEQCRQRCRLAASGCAGDQDQPGLFLCDFGKDIGQSQGLDRGDFAFEFPQDDGEMALLAEDVDAEARFIAE
jgi:hypothetical protein